MDFKINFTAYKSLFKSKKFWLLMAVTSTVTAVMSYAMFKYFGLGNINTSNFNAGFLSSLAIFCVYDIFYKKKKIQIFSIMLVLAAPYLAYKTLYEGLNNAFFIGGLVGVVFILLMLKILPNTVFGIYMYIEKLRNKAHKYD